MTEKWISGVVNIAAYLGLKVRTTEKYIQTKVIPTYKMSGSKKVFAQLAELDNLFVQQ